MTNGSHGSRRAPDARLPAIVAALGALLAWGSARALVDTPSGRAPAATRGDTASDARAAHAEEEAPDASLRAALERMEKRGRVVGPVLPLPTRRDGDGEARFLVLLGHDGVATAAWIAGGERDVPLDDFPAAVRVTGSITAGEDAYLLLESAAALDQPAGLRGVWKVEGARSPGELLAFLGASDVAEATVRATAPRDDVSFDEAEPLLEAIARASPDDAALGALVDGVPWLRVWQGTFLQHVRTLSTSERARAVEIARAALVTRRCEGGVCLTTAGGPATPPGIAVARGPAGAVVVRALLETRPSALVHDATPSTRGLGGSGAAARAVFLAHAEGDAGPSLDVPLGDDGLLAVLGTRVAMKRGAFEQVFALPLAAPPSELRFVDADYDGRPDLLTRSGDCTAVFHTPSSLADGALTPVPHAMALDDGATLRALDAPDLDAATHAVTTFEPYGVAAYDACALLAHVGLSAFALGARVVHTSAVAPTCAPRTRRAEDAPPEDFARLGAACAGAGGAPLACDARRAFCRTAQGDVLAFSRNGELRITKAWIVD